MPALFKQLRITHTDGTEIVCDGHSADLVRFEMHFDMGASVVYDDLRLTYIWFFAYAAESRINSELGSFEQWMETIESVEVIGDETENPPSEPTPTPSP